MPPQLADRTIDARGYNSSDLARTYRCFSQSYCGDCGVVDYQIEKPMPLAKVYSRFLRLFLSVLLISVGLLLLFGAASIPFLYESSTIKYKFGLDKTLLRVAQVLGVCTGYLLLLQLIFSARLKSLDRVFSLNRCLRLHRLNGLVIGILCLLHAILILVTEGLSAISLNVDNWPELVGVCLLLSILTIIFISWWRQSLGLAYHRWWLLHRIGTPLAVVALTVHILYVNDSFKYGFPRTLIFLVIGCYVLLYAWVQIKRFFIKGKPYEVVSISTVGHEAYCIELRTRKNQHLDYIPGQFAFISFTSPHVSKEEHPFTISSTPSRGPNLQFTIRSFGDWTNTMSRLRREDKAFVGGPFGDFGHLRLPESREFIMVAGGIGITPMLSMLRFMADVNDDRKITLIWSNRTRKHMVYPDEFSELEERLAGLSIIHVLTREPRYDGEKGRLDEAKFERLLSGCSKQSTVFTCGPPDMMKDTYWALRRIGFPRRFICMERFSL